MIKLVMAFVTVPLHAEGAKAGCLRHPEKIT
jgi:hypothetical protein